MKIIDEDSDEWSDFISFFEPAFTMAENNAYHPRPKESRSSADLNFFNVTRNDSPHDGYYIYYVEAKKEYPGSRESQCISYLNGWILRDSDGTFSFLEKKFKVHRHEMFYTRGDVPLGVIYLDGKMFWIIRDKGYESERYLLLDVSSSGIRELISVYAGGC